MVINIKEHLEKIKKFETLDKKIRKYLYFLIWISLPLFFYDWLINKKITVVAIILVLLLFIYKFLNKFLKSIMIKSINYFGDSRILKFKKNELSFIFSIEFNGNIYIKNIVLNSMHEIEHLKKLIECFKNNDSNELTKEMKIEKIKTISEDSKEIVFINLLTDESAEDTFYKIKKSLNVTDNL